MRVSLFIMRFLLILLSGYSNDTKTSKFSKGLFLKLAKITNSTSTTNAKRNPSNANKIRTKLVLLNNCSREKTIDKAPRNTVKRAYFDQKIRQTKDSLIVNFKVKDACFQQHRSLPTQIKKTAY